MRKVHVQDLQPGMSLGKEIYNDRGSVLLARGVTLTSRYIDVLTNLGYYSVYIQDGIADDLEPSDVLSDQVHISVTKHVRELFSIAQGAPSARQGDTIRSVAANLINSALPNVAQLFRDVESIIEQATTSKVLSGVTSLKSHDNYTFEHSVDVAVAGVLLGIRMHLQPFELNQLAMGCLSHDIGKLAVPLEILQKTSPLTDEEWAIMRKHPGAGYDIVRELMGSSDIIARQVVWQHHERQDGTGYPRNLRGNNEFQYPQQSRFGRGLILPVAEIAALAEVYANLASDHTYRPALPPIRVAATLRELAGTHLNRELVKRFLAILPVFPVGTEVVVIGGKFRRHRGVVTSINPDDLQRPRIRIIFDPQGDPVVPFEVDSSEERDVELAVMSYLDMAGDQPSPAPSQAGTGSVEPSEPLELQEAAGE